MEDKFKYTSLIVDTLKYILTIILIFLVLVACYYIWFFLGGHPVEEKEISIKIISPKDSSAILQNQQQLSELKQILKQIEDQQIKNEKLNQRQKREEYLTVSTLNAFYASLFTAIAVIIAILGLSAWKTKSNLDKKLKKLKEIDQKVTFLHQKKKLAGWARELFENNNQNDISSTELNLSADDKKEMSIAKGYMTNEITDDSWLEIVLAKQLIDEANNKKKNLDKAIKVFEFIENRDLLDEKSNIEAVLYHMLGQAYQEKYKFAPDKDKNKLLISSKEYYEKAIDCDEHRDETQGNLAVVLIELAKLNDNNKKENYLEEAAKHLNKVISLNKETYNTYYDLARAKYLENNNEEETKKYLFKSVEKINSIKQKNKFIEFLEQDDILKNIKNWCNILGKIKTEINKKLWLK